MVGNTNRKHTQLSQSVKVHTSHVIHFTNAQCSRENQSVEPVFYFFTWLNHFVYREQDRKKPEITIATGEHFHEIRAIVMHVILNQFTHSRFIHNQAQPKISRSPPKPETNHLSP